MKRSPTIFTTPFGLGVKSTPRQFVHGEEKYEPIKKHLSGLASVLCGVLLAASSWAPDVSGTTYYVDNTNVSASDSNAGTSPALPFLTMGKGAAIAVAGDTVRVLAGTYAETVKPNSGTAGNPVTFSATPGVTVTGLAGNSTNGGAFRITSKSYIVVDGFTITSTADYGIIVDTSSHITISNNHVSYSGTSSAHRIGIYLRVTTDSIISGNTTDHNTMDGIRLTNNSHYNTVSNNISFGNAEGTGRNACGINLPTNSTYNTIIHNITYANEDTGLNFYDGSSYNLVIGNVTYGNGDHGIDNNAAPNNVFIGNTVQGNVTVGINLEGATSPGSGGATVINNISVDNGLRRQTDGSMSIGSPGNIRVDAQSLVGTTLDYNLFYLNTGTVQVIWGSTSYTSLAAFKAAQPSQEIHGLEANPLLAAPAPIAERPYQAPYNVAINVGDYHLTAGSPAIDSANSDAPSEPALDIEGNAREDDLSAANTGAGTRPYDDRGAYEYDPDTDNDGIQDWWMMQHFGHPTGQASDHSLAQDDPDGDNYTNLEEYHNGTDPTKFDIGPAMIWTAVEIGWKTVVGTNYQVQCTTNLASSNWDNFGSVIVGNGLTYTVFDSTRTNSHKFYRVVVP